MAGPAPPAADAAAAICSEGDCVSDVRRFVRERRRPSDIEVRCGLRGPVGSLGAAVIHGSV